MTHCRKPGLKLLQKANKTVYYQPPQGTLISRGPFVGNTLEESKPVAPSRSQQPGLLLPLMEYSFTSCLSANKSRT